MTVYNGAKLTNLAPFYTVPGIAGLGYGIYFPGLLYVLRLEVTGIHKTWATMI